MNAGDLDRPLEVYTRVQTRVEGGGLEETLELVATIGRGGKFWGNVRALNGQKFFAAMQVQSTMTHEIRCRFMEGFRTNQVLKHQAERGKYQFFTIDAVQPIEDDKTRLSLMCTLRESEGWR